MSRRATSSDTLIKALDEAMAGYPVVANVEAAQ